ncbi:MAG: hypothetical protein OEO77_06945 [Acidimicrobiia bacterium]|nr:hypothetical protein [Acidimicrobiia bacterium]
MKRWTSLVAVATALLMVIAAPAFAVEHDSPEDPEGLSVDYDPDAHVIVFGIDVDCSVEGLMGEFVTDEDGTITFVPDEEVPDPGLGFGTTVVEGEDEAETAPLEGCTLVSGEGPNGQVNHGSIVSNTVKALKALRDSGELEGPFGQAVKEIAHSQWGKGDQKVKTKDVELDDEGEGEISELEATTEKAPKVKKNNGKAKGRP